MNARLQYLENVVQGASPVQIVVLLYEQAIQDLRKALAAHMDGSIEERTRQINHALLVLGYLEASLDKTMGGQVAVNLERFYKTVRVGLVEAQCQQSGAAIERQIAMLVEVRDAWCQVDRGMAAARTAPTPAAGDTPRESQAREGWKA